MDESSTSKSEESTTSLVIGKKRDVASMEESNNPVVTPVESSTIGTTEVIAAKKKKKREAEPNHEFPRPPVVIQVVTMPKTHIDHTYRDFSLVPREKGYKEPTRIEDMSFAFKVHHILSSEEYGETISWLPHGRAFKILRPKRLEDDNILQHYFGHNRYSSFLIQLKKYGFKSITQGKDRGAFYHEFMLRGLPHLCKYMPEFKECRRLIPDPEHEPDFYAISTHWPVPESKLQVYVRSVSSQVAKNLDTAKKPTASAVKHAPAPSTSTPSFTAPVVPNQSMIQPASSALQSLDGMNLSQLSPALLLQLIKRHPNSQPETSRPPQSPDATTNAATPAQPLPPEAFKAKFLQNNALSTSGFHVAGLSSLTPESAPAAVTPGTSTAIQDLLKQISGGGANPIGFSGPGAASNFKLPGSNTTAPATPLAADPQADQQAISSLLEQIRQRRLRNALEMELILLENQSAENLRAARRNGTSESILNLIQNATTNGSSLLTDPRAASLSNSAREATAAAHAAPQATSAVSNALLAALLNNRSL